MRKTSYRVAFGGITAALMVALMLLGPMIPTMTYVFPALAGVLILPIRWEFGPKTGVTLYLAVALLSLFLCPNKESALFFALLFGWYPLVRPKLQHIQPKAGRVAVKIILFNLALAVIALLMVFVFMLPVLEEGTGLWLAAGLLLLGNVTFLLYDVFLARCGDLYVLRLRPKLFPRHRS